MFENMIDNFDWRFYNSRNAPRSQGAKNNGRKKPLNLGKSKNRRNSRRNLRRKEEKELLNNINKAFDKKSKKAYNKKGKLDIGIELSLKWRDIKYEDDINLKRDNWEKIANDLRENRKKGDYKFNRFMMINYIKEMI